MAANLQYTRSFFFYFLVSICLVCFLSAGEAFATSSLGDVSFSQLQSESADLDDTSILIEAPKHSSHRHKRHSHAHHHPLSRREDFTCGPDKPCSNGACCGASGNCGFGRSYTNLVGALLILLKGPVYCGDGCTSNCNATAPCGKYHKTPGTTCPLNTCCSEWGFCGTSTEFCNTKCQSNCELHPTPKSSGGQVLDKGTLYGND
jgi:hypothetical protein